MNQHTNQHPPFYESLSLFLEMPSSFIDEPSKAKTGAFLFAYETTVSLLNAPFKQLYIITDSTVEKARNFCQIHNISSPYQIIKLSDIATISKTNDRLMSFLIKNPNKKYTKIELQKRIAKIIKLAPATVNGNKKAKVIIRY